MADIQGIFVIPWPGCSNVFFDAQFSRDCVDRLLLFAASVSSDFSDCESLAFAVRDFIFAILNSFFLRGQRICF